MSGGSQPKPTTTTTTAQMSPEQQQLWNLALPGIQQFAANVPKRYQGDTVANFDPSQTAGQEMALKAAGAQQGIADSSAGALNKVFTDLWSPDTPEVQATIAASTRPITQNLMETVLPGLRSEAVGSGNFGSSRQGIAEGLASGRASQAIGDTASKITTDLYKTNVDATLKALGLTPTIQQAQLAPGITTSGVGDVRQAQAQKELDAQIAGFNFDQFAPFLQSKELLSLIQGIPGGTSTAVGTGPSTNPVLQGLGGAATGASLGSALFPGVGTVAGAGLGALLPFLLK